MSNFNCKVKIKKTGEIKDVYAQDNYFGMHQYGYADGDKIYHEEEVELILEPKPEPIEEDENVYCKTTCPSCGDEMSLPKWQMDKHKEDKDYYCSESCRYNAETGHPGEEY